MSTIEITGIRIRPAFVPLRRPLNTRVGRFTHGPFLLIDLETKGGVGGRALCFTFIPLAQRTAEPQLIPLISATLPGRKLGFPSDERGRMPRLHARKGGFFRAARNRHDDETARRLVGPAGERDLVSVGGPGCGVVVARIERLFREQHTSSKEFPIAVLDDK